MTHPAMLSADLTSLPLLAKGKVRENYGVGTDRMLMVATDRISAFDVVMGEPVAGKGVLLTQMALFWFGKLHAIVPNHLTPDDPLGVVGAHERDRLQGRSMLVKRLTPLPVEAVVRGYLAGSGWAEYQQSQSVCGVALPAGFANASRLPQAIFTPATKAALGEHDENISFERMCAIVGEALAQQIKTVSLELYNTAASYARSRGVIIADTKFEFGLDAQGTLTLMDEVLTPDSSRYWPEDGYALAAAQGLNPPSFDKQFLRDWLDAQPWDKTAPAPAVPAAVIEQTALKYREVFTRLVD